MNKPIEPQKMEYSGPCMIWPGTRTVGGYGRMRNREGRLEVAHRAIYKNVVGPIPDGLQLDHLCRNRLCVNPAHMEPVTNRINALRGIGVGARNAQKTHCKNGHPLSGDNLIAGVDKRGAWCKCRACKRAVGFERYHRTKVLTRGPLKQSPMHCEYQASGERWNGTASDDAGAIVVSYEGAANKRACYDMLRRRYRAWQKGRRVPKTRAYYGRCDRPPLAV